MKFSLIGCTALVYKFLSRGFAITMMKLWLPYHQELSCSAEEMYRLDVTAEVKGAALREVEGTVKAGSSSSSKQQHTTQ